MSASPRATGADLTTCPACGSHRVRLGPISLATGRRIGRCPHCHAHFWANTDAVDTSAEDDAAPAAGRTADDYSQWVDIKREQAGPEAWRETAGWLQRTVTARGTAKPRLYDVGAGDGQFLSIARDEFGFDVTGNDVVPGAVALAKQRYDVTLDLGDLAGLAHREEFDAATLWCVLAHVDDGEQLLSEVHALLRPGGLLALQTPHWTAADAAAHGLQRVSRGRVNKITDRRIAQHHRILHTRRSITELLERVGFTDVVATPQQRYTLTSYAYLASMNPPAWTLKPATWLLDRAVSSSVAPRIVLDVQARRR